MAFIKVNPAEFTFKIYQDEKKEWRWQIKSSKNHETVGAATEGFDSKRNALNNFKLLADLMYQWHEQEKKVY